jgi:dolichol-phosphate mannosyltransferase
MTFSVIIPTYNEEDVIVDIIAAVRNEISPLEEIIIVDDNSTDLTRPRVEQLARADRKIRLIRRDNEKNLATAIAEGIRCAAGDWVMWFDADFSAPPGTLTALINSASGADIVVASRYVRGGKDARDDFLRVAASYIFNWFARLVLRTAVKDLTSGQIIARRSIFDCLAIKGLYGEYCIRFLYEASRKGFKIKETPYVYFSRKKGKSKTTASPGQFLKYCLVYVSEVFKLTRSKS